MEIIGAIWNAVIIGPMTNGLVFLYSVFFNNFGLSIIGFTLLVRGVMIPLTIKQSRQLRGLTQLQPKLKDIQTRYAKDRQRISQETLKLYKEHGVNPFGCLGPMFIQFPIWIGLYQSILLTVPSTPESLIKLSRHLYAWLPSVHQVVPIDSSFLWLDLAEPDPSPLVLPIMVGASMFLMQKMTTMPSVDPRQESTNRMMLWMMPIMFGFFTITFPSGLALYWVVSNIVGIVIQGFITGWGPLISLVSRSPKEPSEPTELVPTEEEAVIDENNRDHRQDDRRSNRDRPKGTRRRPRRGRDRRR